MATSPINPQTCFMKSTSTVRYRGIIWNTAGNCGLLLATGSYYKVVWGYCRILQDLRSTAEYWWLLSDAGYCRVMWGSLGYCKVLRSTAGYTMGLLGGNYLGTVEYCRYWSRTGGLYSTRSALQYLKVPLSISQYPEVPWGTQHYPSLPLSTLQDLQVLSVLGVLGGTRGTGGITPNTLSYPLVPWSNPPPVVHVPSIPYYPCPSTHNNSSVHSAPKKYFTEPRGTLQYPAVPQSTPLLRARLFIVMFFIILILILIWFDFI